MAATTLFRGKKSGRVRTADDRVQKIVSWPHFYVYDPTTAESIKYNELNVQQFMFGFCNQILDNWKNMIVHLKELMQDASDISWENARNYHGLILNHFERKSLSGRTRRR